MENRAIKRTILFFFHALLVALILCNPWTSWGATYYMRADGSAANKGAATSCSAAGTAMNATVHNGETFSANDVLTFCGDATGGVFRATITPPSSGSSGQPITYNCASAPCTVNGANVLTSWSQESGSVYSKASVTTEPNQVFYDNVRLTENDGATTGVSANQWDWAANTLYINVGEDPAGGTVEASQRDSPIQYAQNYITVDGLHVTKGNSAGGGSIYNAGTNNTIRNCEVSYATHHGIAVVTPSASTLIDNNSVHNNGNGVATDSAGIFVYKDAAGSGTENIISNNDVYNNRSFGIYIISNYNIVDNNTVRDNGNTTDMTVGIEMFNSDNDGYARYNTVRYNTVYGQISGVNNGEGIDFDDYSAFNTAYYNLVYGNDGPGMTMWKSNNNSFYNNVVYGNALNSGGALTTKAEIDIDSSGANLTDNNVVKNNIAFATQASTYAVWIGPYSYNSTGLSITNNDWYRASGNWYFWNATGGNVLATWNALTGVGTDLNADPLFVSASDFHLQSSSPAINAGVNLSLASDYEGNAPGNPPEIGAYEYLNAGNWYVDQALGVDTDNGTQAAPWKTIAKVNAATFNPGNIIHITGDFSERLNTPSAGTSGNPITFDLYGARFLGTDIDYQIIADSEYTTIKNATLIRVADTGTGPTGIRITAANVTADNNTITGQGVSGSVEYSRGIDLRAAGGTATRNIIDNVCVGIWVNGQGFAGTIGGSNGYGNTIHDMTAPPVGSADGISVSSTRSQIEDYTGLNISYNTVSEWKDDGIDLYWASNAIVEHNEVGPFSSTTSVEDGNGIKCGHTGSTGNIVRYNYVHDIDGSAPAVNYGITTNGAGNVQIYYNIVKNAARNLAVLLGEEGHEIYNNVFKSARVRGAWFQDNVTSTSFRNNIVEGTAQDLYLNAGDNVIGGNNIFINDTCDEHSASQYTNTGATDKCATDPLFVSSSDFHLQSSSPAINAGVDVGLTVDYAGNPIVGLPDMGAYEWQPGVPVLVSPISGSAGWPVVFTWTVVPGAILYHLQVDDSGVEFPSPEIDDATIDPATACDTETCEYPVAADTTLDYNTHYYWRTRVLR